MTEDGNDMLQKTLVRNANGAQQKMAEGNLYGAFEEFYVGFMVARVAMNTEPERLTPEYVKLVRRMAWALSGLEVGDGARVADDLEGAEEFAESIQNRERSTD